MESLEREQNEIDVPEALGDYKCDVRMSVENVSVVKSVEKKNSVVDQFVVNYKSEFLHNRSEKV